MIFLVSTRLSAAVKGHHVDRKADRSGANQRPMIGSHRLACSQARKRHTSCQRGQVLQGFEKNVSDQENPVITHRNLVSNSRFLRYLLFSRYAEETVRCCRIRLIHEILLTRN